MKEKVATLSDLKQRYEHTYEIKHCFSDSLSKRQCDSVCYIHAIFHFPLLHVLGMRLCINFTGFTGHQLHVHVILQVSLVHTTTEHLKYM